jgi:hypothetical protein
LDSTCVGVRTCVGDEEQRGVAVAVDADQRLVAAAVRDERTDDLPREREVARPLSVPVAALVDPPHSLGVDPDARAEAEPPAVDAAERDPARPSALERVRDPPRSVLRIARQAERTRQHARPAARDEADQDIAVDAVEDLVEAAVAGERDDRCRRRSIARELGRVAFPLCVQRRHGRGARELALDRSDALLGDVGRDRVDDQHDLAHAREAIRANRCARS